MSEDNVDFTWLKGRADIRKELVLAGDFGSSRGKVELLPGYRQIAI